MATGKRIAVVGSGITGLSSAWLLHRSGAKVTLFEAEPSCGGHTLTDSTGQWPVDLGFQVYNLTTYPNLVGFLEALDVDTEPSEMSFSLSMDGGKLEWASHDLSTIFVQKRNLLSPSFLRMIYDVIRFGREAPKVLDPAQAHVFKGVTLGQYLQEQGYSESFKNNYVLPMCAAVWSVPNATVLAFPVQMLVRFWVNHHLLDLVQRPCWRVVKGRSKTYVDKVLAELPDVRTSTPISSLQRNSNGSVTLITAAGKKETFDAVVLATHSDISLQILGQGATKEERAVLSAIPYNNNDVYLHTDVQLMPVDKKAWASWNFLGSTGTSDEAAVTVSYWLNRLQHLPAEAPEMFATLNPPQPPAANTIIRKLQLAHPVYSYESYAAQARLPAIQGTGGVFFAGAWASYGFHEDGIKAGVAAARLLGAEVPWGSGIATSPKMGLTDMLWLALFDRFGRAAISQGQLRLILPNGEERHYGGAEHTVPAPVPSGEEWRGLPPRSATVRVLRMDMFRKVVQRTDVGLGEAYMDGDYLVDDLGSFMALMVANARNLEGQKGMLGLAQWANEKLLAAAHARRSNTREGSRKNIEEHYDAGNAMYATFLDESMTYSAGVHTQEQQGDLKAAQMAKLDAVIAAADLQPSDHVLEIGCGWGSFAMRAASTRGCRVTGLTLSKEQLAEATVRVAAAGLSDKVTLLFCDYRDCPNLGSYDKVVSIEMIEAVGHEHLVSYFATINAALKPGGKAVIQVIAQPDERYEKYCRESDFIREHIFPGGHLPSMGAMVEAARGTDLAVTAVRDIGPDYAITLRAWREAWGKRRRDVLALGYSDKFWLKYDFYFAYCEAAFDAKYIHDFHVTWEKCPAAAAASHAGTVARARAMAAVAVGDVAGSSVAWVKQELQQQLPSDSITQVLLAVYFLLAGMIVQRQPILWVMPITSTLFAALHSIACLLGSWTSKRYNSLSPLQRACCCSLLCQLAFSAAASAAAALLLLSHPLELLPRSLPLPAAAVQLLTSAGPAVVTPVKLIANSILGGSAIGSLIADANVQQLATLLTCAAAGYYAFRLWLLVRSRAAHQAGQLLALLQYTLLLLVYSVASYKGSQVGLLAAALICEAAGVPAAAGEVLDLLAAAPGGRAGSVMRRSLLLTERLTFPLLRVLPQVGITVAVVLSPAAFGSGEQAFHAYCLCLALLGLCHLMSVIRARQVYSAAAGGVAIKAQ